MAVNPNRIRTAAGFAALLSVFGILSSSSAVRQILRTLFSPTAHPFRFTSLVLALILNAKSIPLVWHLRFFRIMFYQLYLQPSPLPQDALFRPMVTSKMYTPIPEIDYNGHKSNSTYFADFDMARTQLITCLLRHGIRNVSSRKHLDLPDGEVRVGVEDGNVPEQSKARKLGPAIFNVFLGAVSCHFKKEIKPYERFDIWTRTLTWDKKWVYQVSHMVKSGAIPPEHWALQPALNSKSAKRATDKKDEDVRAEWKKAIFATSISKYVFKRGRQTIPPEFVLNSSHLLPPRPNQPANENSKKPFSGTTIPEGWTWEGVEQERLRGLRIAEHFDALDAPGGLHDEFPVSGMPGVDGKLEVLGEFRDLYL